MKHELYWSGRGAQKTLTERIFSSDRICVFLLHRFPEDQHEVLQRAAYRKGISTQALEKRLLHARASRPIRIPETQ